MFIYLLLGTLVILLIMSRDALKKYKLDEKAEDELIRDFEDI
jgi:hypothetical protein